MISGSQPQSSHLQLVGHNTDWSGFMADLENLEGAVTGRACLVLGAGGSARAVVYGLASAGGHIHIFSRRKEQARKVVADLLPLCPAGRLEGHHWPALVELSDQVGPGCLIVNTTPVGMAPSVEASPWPEEVLFPRNAFVYDLVYQPAETRLMSQAQAAGCQTANGSGMLLHQGAQAFFLWTGKHPDLDIMAAAMEAGDDSPATS